jgi:cation diffusion facilitator family transporter
MEMKETEIDEKSLLFKRGEKAAKLSAAVLLAFSVLKGVVAIVSGSVALLADSVHSFADVFSSVAVWAGLKLIQRKPTERFPYGYFKAETFALLIVAITIASSGVLILMEVVDKLSEPAVVLFSTFVLIVSALSGLVSYILSRYKQSVGSLIGSQSLVGEGQHSMVDVYTSLLVFVGVLFSSFGYSIAEVLAGLVIGIYVVKVGLWFGKDAVLVLMDASLSPQRSREMKEIAEGVHGVAGAHNTRLRKSGPVSFGEMHIEVQKDLPLDKAHAISSEVEKRIKQRFRDVESITINVGLAHKERMKIGVPIVEDKGLESVTSPHFGNVPFFAFIEAKNGQIANVYVKANKAAGQTRKRGIEAARFLAKEKVDVVLAGGMGEGPFHLLKDSMVQIYLLPERVRLKEAIHLLSENKLETVTTPTEMHDTEKVE